MRKAVLVVLAGLLAVLAGCGVRPTGVLGGGMAAAGVATGPVLYFVKGGLMAPVQRNIGHLGDATTALSLLFAGPTDADLAAGLTTDLPPRSVPDSAASSVYVDDGSVVISVLMDVRALSPIAVEQIVCTVVGVKAMARTVDPRNVWAVLRGKTGALPAAQCPLFRK
ncbi:MAG: hypothetical protein JWQ81_8651 [Amycolatopsis sp.]|jgi:hypothetical protein|uniref:hypothetical protein n=1 Tax=Amycolatopsis sp. TaxID=37632 RepID=UPI0026291A72|nr:hypothetical protein [Amycolatopsis sp.]MCU1687912.1 hypothetical protein [Amycolatopsis sp.]